MKIINEVYKQVIIDRFGSRRGALSTFWHKLKHAFGAYSDYKKIDWDKIDRLVFVCKGNICRSAYAEAVARSFGVDAASSGICAKSDLPANPDAITVARVRNIDLSCHKTTPVMRLKLKKTDLIVAMEPWQAAYLNDNLKSEHYITLLGLWGPSKRPHLPDPYGRTAKYFNNCFEYIEKSVYEIEKKIKEH